VKSIAGGGEHCFALGVEGELYGCGSNLHGQLAMDPKTDSRVQCFKRVPGPLAGEQIEKVAVGFRHSVLLLASGSVLVCGDGGKGQLGLGDQIRSAFRWTKVNLPGKAVDVAAGVYMTLAVLEDGRVIGWGANRKSQLRGDQKDPIIWSPLELNFPCAITKIVAGHHHILGLSTTGTLLSRGPIRVPSFERPILDVFSGWKFGAIRYTDDPDELVLFGSNDLGQLCSPHPTALMTSIRLPHVIQIAVGGEHGLVLTKEGLWTWGWNEHGCLAQGHTNPAQASHPIKVASSPEHIQTIFAGYGACYMMTAEHA
jgi:protein ATS1